jgi:hypothetical protein
MSSLIFNGDMDNKDGQRDERQVIFRRAEKQLSAMSYRF